MSRAKMKLSGIIAVILALFLFSTAVEADTEEDVELLIVNRNTSTKLTKSDVLKVLKKANLMGRGFKKEVSYQTVKSDGSSTYFKKSYFYYKLENCSKIPRIEEDLDKMIPGVFGNDVANRLKTELPHWGLKNMGQCKVGLEVVSTEVDNPYRQTRGFFKKLFKIGIKVVGAGISGGIEGAVEGYIQGGLPGARQGAVEGAVTGAKEELKKILRPSSSSRRHSTSSRRRSTSSRRHRTSSHRGSTSSRRRSTSSRRGSTSSRRRSTSSRRRSTSSRRRSTSSRRRSTSSRRRSTSSRRRSTSSRRGSTSSRRRSTSSRRRNTSSRRRSTSSRRRSTSSRRRSSSDPE